MRDINHAMHNQNTMKGHKEQWRLFFKGLLWPVGTLAGYGLCRNVVFDKIAYPFWTTMNLCEGVWLDLSVSLFAVGCVVLGWFSKRKCYSPHLLGLFLSAWLLALLFFFDKVGLPFLRYFGLIPCWFVLLGAFLIGLVSHYLFEWLKLIFCKPKAIIELPTVLLFQDRPVDEIERDCLFYSNLARQIAGAIMSNTWDASFSIGVTGSWGAGKTTVLLFVKQLLAPRNDTIVIDFSPRQSATVQDIQKDFLSQFAKRLSKYHSGAIRVAHKYMLAIGALPDYLWLARLVGSVTSDKVIQSRENLEWVVRRIRKKIVVLIDDFDRLSGEEIQEVLKLIDKNAAFPNTFFVTAYDKEQANQVLSNTLGYKMDPKTVGYMDKYFNVEISLPIRRQRNYLSVLRECLYSLSDNRVISSGRKEIDNALPGLYRFIRSELSSIRDIKRYSSLIAATLPLVEEDVFLGDFLLVSLIRYKYPEEYYLLGRNKYVRRENDAKRMVLWPTDYQNAKSKTILEVLFNREVAPYRSISHISSFAHYFYDIDSGHLFYRELSQLLAPSITPTEFGEIVNGVVKSDEDKADFAAFVLSHESQVKNKSDAAWYFRFFLMARTYCNSGDLHTAFVSYLLKDNINENLKLFGFESEVAFVGFLKDVLNNKYDFRLSLESIHDVLYSIASATPRGAVQFVFSHEELKDFARKKLERALSEVPKMTVTPSDVFRAYKACVSSFSVSDRRELLDPEATALIRSGIASFPDFFLKEFVSHRNNPSTSSSILLFVDEKKVPYRDIFNDIKDFDDFLTSVSFAAEDGKIELCLSQFAGICLAQNTWEPALPINGDISSIKQYDYDMYNKLFEGEPVSA